MYFFAVAFSKIYLRFCAFIRLTKIARTKQGVHAMKPGEIRANNNTPVP
jgi:hypothetical protein